MSESMADFEKEIDESLKTLNVVENEGEATEEETGFNAWDKVQQYLEDGTVLTLKVGGIVNKGVIVYVDGLRGFIPASHLEIGYVEDTNPYLGKTVEAKVITADPEKNRLVLSVKEVLYDKKRAEKEARINKEIERCGKTFIPPNAELKKIVEERNTPLPATGITLSELIKRPELDYACLEPVDKGRPELSRREKQEVEIKIKYDGYIRREKAQAEQYARLERKKIPADVDYSQIKGLRIEAAQKLKEARPASIGQASRLSGVNPADVSVLLIYFGMV